MKGIGVDAASFGACRTAALVHRDVPEWLRHITPERSTVPTGMDRLSESDYVVVDLETTGFAAHANDRIVEVAVLRCRPGAGIVDRFVTLVDPQRPVGASRIHGVGRADVGGAPTFAKIASALRERLEGGVIVAHNSRFDLAFLEAELRRAGLALPDRPTLCTMGLAGRLGVPVRGRSLATCCAHFEIPLEREHGAEHDAQATARLLLCLLREARAQGLDSLAALGCAPAPRGEGPRPRSTGPVPEPAAAPARLATAARHVGDRSPITDVDTSAYLDLLDRVLLDRVVTPAEVDALRAMARRCRLGDREVGAAHREYLHRLADVAWEDGGLTPEELRDIAHVGALLGLDAASIDKLIDPGRTAWVS
jgi:DNA polymerase-3 subunit epsilon